MDKTDIISVIDKCFCEFCEVVGDGPCGCDACTYSEYNTVDNENGCYQEYVKNKMLVFKS